MLQVTLIVETHKLQQMSCNTLLHTKYMIIQKVTHSSSSLWHKLQDKWQHNHTLQHLHTHAIRPLPCANLQLHMSVLQNTPISVIVNNKTVKIIINIRIRNNDERDNKVNDTV